MKVLSSVIINNISLCEKHNHPYWEFVYRLSGSSNTTIDNRTHQISKGDLYLVPPNIFHSDTAQNLFSDLVIHVDNIDFTDVLILHDYDTSIASLTQLINRIMNKKEGNYQNIANSLLDALFQYIRPFSLSLIKNHFVQKLKNTIFDNVENTDFNLTEEIKNMGYHPDYVRRCFKAETKKTPHSYLIDLRIDRAKQLLVMPNFESIELISEKCGFKDQLYFSKVFKKKMGISPREHLKFIKENK